MAAGRPIGDDRWMSLTGLSAALILASVAGDAEFFEKSVRPILAARCYECHSADADRVEGGLRLDTRAAAVRGGDSGPALDPNDPAASWLLDAVRYETYEMPPAGPLPEGERAVIEEWFERGAAWPDDGQAVDDDGGFDIAARKASHWCWQPVGDPPPPAVAGAAWVRDPVDAFVLAKLEAAGLEPAAEAGRETWLRRATFALRGMPPTPEERAAFLADDAPDAHARVVDRLLAEPAFGETWGRHWLDLARYAESYGHEFDYAIPHAAGYRDWVIRAVNADVPFDRFAAEQIAGDLLPPRPGPGGVNEAELATGFWWLGEAVHAPTDVREDEAIRVENQIDAYSKAFLGLTVACARCHDHKFDAISAADYYALYGVLKSTRRRTSGLDPDGRLASAADRIDDLRGSGDAPAFEPPEGDIPSVARWEVDGPAFVVSTTPQPDWQRRRTVPAGVATSAARAAELRGTLRSPPFELTGSRVHLLVRSAGGPATARLVIGGYHLHERHQLLFKGTRLKSIKTGGRWKWLTMSGDVGRFAGETVHIEVDDAGGGWAEIAAAVQSDGPPPAGPMPDDGPAPELPPESLAGLGELASSLPTPPPALTAGDGPGLDETLHIRGNPNRRGGPVPRRFLEAVDGGPFGDRSGRLELARATVSPDNPLFARVAVNRVWHHLFGRGLVPTVDDFGAMGRPPSHPGLLDRLAADFADDGYRRKRLIRRLMLSSAYRMGSRATPAMRAATAAADPDNALLHRFPVRRLTAEAARDAMLAASGRLAGPPPAGRSVPTHLDEFATGRGRPGESGPLDGEGRRTVYLAVRRNFLPAWRTTFDFPPPAGPVGRRNVSNVPAQGLATMNGPLVRELAAALGDRVRAEAGDAGGRIERLFLLALSREPGDDERAAFAAFVGEGTPEDWADAAHAVFNAKEFLYLR